MRMEIGKLAKVSQKPKIKTKVKQHRYLALMLNNYARQFPFVIASFVRFLRVVFCAINDVNFLFSVLCVHRIV